MCCGRLIFLQHDKGLANVVICDPSREFLNAIMYCDFKLMVRLSLFFFKQVLQEVYAGCITLVDFVREEVRHAFVDFGHEIV